VDTKRKEMVVNDTWSLNQALEAVKEYYVTTYAPFLVCLYKDEPKISRNQQNTFRGWCRLIGDWNGDDAQAIHDFFCKKFLGVEVREAFGKTEEVIVGTSGMSRKAMSRFMQQTEAYIVQNLSEIKLPQWEDE